MKQSQSRKIVGNAGEDLVCKKLQMEGFSILARNFQRQSGEIDIIAAKGSLLIFVEVKTRHNPLFDMTELITVSKQKKIVSVAKAFLAHYSKPNMICRFDVALVTQSQSIEYIENAFMHE